MTEYAPLLVLVFGLYCVGLALGWILPPPWWKRVIFRRWAQEGLTMRLRCYFCGKSVSTEVDADTVVRAVLVCPECIEAGKIEISSVENRAWRSKKGTAKWPN